MRAQLLYAVALGALVAGCGDTSNERMTTGGLGGAAVGALAGGPVGAIIGGGVGVAGGAALDESADQKIREAANNSNGPRQLSGSAENGRVLTRDQVHNRLHNAGYEHVYNIRRDGDVYKARTERDGRYYNVVVDASSGGLISANQTAAALRGTGNGNVAQQKD